MDALYECSKCRKILASSNFHKGNTNRSRPVSAYCKPCKKQHSKDNVESYRATRQRYYKSHKEEYLARSRQSKRRPEVKAKARDAYLMRTYGITSEDYSRMIKAQGDLCAICRRSKPTSTRGHWQVDHCHKTGKVRGLLCHDCNVGLAKFKDNTEALIRAASYLKEAA